MASVARVRHLVRRALTSLRGREASEMELAWARPYLTAGEQALFDRMSTVDQAHAVEVARNTLARQIGASEEIIRAALMHDVGKVESRCGVPGRVLATLIGPAVPQRLRPRLGRFGRYLAYPEIGADLLRDAGSTGLVVQWAREHHLPRHEWGVNPAIGQILQAADDEAS